MLARDEETRRFLTSALIDTEHSLDNISDQVQ
jgi:hypothetical protein